MAYQIFLGWSRLPAARGPRFDTSYEYRPINSSSSGCHFQHLRQTAYVHVGYRGINIFLLGSFVGELVYFYLAQLRCCATCVCMCARGCGMQRLVALWRLSTTVAD